MSRASLLFFNELFIQSEDVEDHLTSLSSYLLVKPRTQIYATISAPNALFARLIFCNCCTEIRNLLP